MLIDSHNFLLRNRLLVPSELLVLHKATTLPLKVPPSAIVIASDICFILTDWCPLLGNVHIYSASVRSIHSATVVAFLLVVRLVGLGSPVLTFLLLLTRVLAIVDLDSYSDILV